MKLRLAKSAGFCYGVRRAVELAGEAAASGRPCVMLGSIIHNRDVVGSLAQQGVTAVDRVEDVPQGCGVIIRSHGESRAVYKTLEPLTAIFPMPLPPIPQLVPDTSQR